MIERERDVKMGNAGKLRLVNPQFISQYNLDFSRSRFAVCMELRTESGEAVQDNYTNP